MMDLNNKPLISFCIPTYNRAEYLQKCIESILSQEQFDARTEIVISDNCSTDDTEKICTSYAEKYTNIKYYRNEENLIDQNFPLSLQRANGLFRKLTNDTIIYKPGTLKYILQAVKNNLNERPMVYFLSSGKAIAETQVAESLEEFINLVGINMTWIRSVAIWEDDCEDLSIFLQEAQSCMAQVPFLLTNFRKREKAVIYDQPIMDMLEVPHKNLKYGLFQVFYQNFLEYIVPCVETGEITETCYQELRKKILLDFFSIWVPNWELCRDQYVFSDENLKQLIKDAYQNERYYWKYLIAKERNKASIRYRRLFAGDENR